ncbi:hypothetical protein AVEN_235239-1 [Araneus ventricosus]|uniref:Uncharacterized protein n=1 Tax=Araneus ventricosus TaxID=182803 RepID=A0A4Y2A374_ARAVE|nr:hypothetical protein AVEN_235239-1 [Araneus ventricosus]
MPFGPVNPIDKSHGQYEYNYNHSRKPLCYVSYGHIARGPGQLSGNKNRCVVNHVSLREHGNHSIGQYLSIHKDSFSKPPANRRVEKAVLVDRSQMMKFKAS